MSKTARACSAPLSGRQWPPVLEAIAKLRRIPERNAAPQEDGYPTHRSADHVGQVATHDLHAKTDVAEPATSCETSHPARWLGGQSAMRDHRWG